MSVRLLLAAVWLKPVLAGDKVRTARAWGDGRDAFVVARPGSRRFLDRAAAAGPSVLSPAGRRAVAGLVANGLLDGRAAVAGRAVLTLRGRLLADTVVVASSSISPSPLTFCSWYRICMIQVSE